MKGAALKTSGHLDSRQRLRHEQQKRSERTHLDSKGILYKWFLWNLFFFCQNLFPPFVSLFVSVSHNLFFPISCVSLSHRTSHWLSFFPWPCVFLFVKQSREMRTSCVPLFVLIPTTVPYATLMGCKPREAKRKEKRQKYTRDRKLMSPHLSLSCLPALLHFFFVTTTKRIGQMSITDHRKSKRIILFRQQTDKVG